METSIIFQREMQSIIDRLTPAIDPKSISESRKRVNQSYSIYTQMRQDFRREELYGVETVYLMDFSELYPYLHPLGGPEPARIVSAVDSIYSEFVIENSEIAMILPPAALSEFLDHINYLSSRVKQFLSEIPRKLFEFQRSAYAEEVKLLLRDVPKNKQTLLKTSAEIETKWRDIFSFWQEIGDPYYQQTLKRLNFLCTNKLKSIAQTLHIHDIDIDHFAYRQALDYLSSKRPLRPRQNERDAINFACASYLSGFTFRRKECAKYLTLITRGWALNTLGQLAFSYDPIKDEGNLERAGILRNIRYAVTRTILEKIFKDPSDRVETAGSLLQEVSFFSRILDYVEKSAREGTQINFNKAFIWENFGASLMERHSMRIKAKAKWNEISGILQVMGIEGFAKHAKSEDEKISRLFFLVDTPVRIIEKNVTEINHTLSETRAWIEEEIESIRKTAGARKYPFSDQAYIKGVIIERGNYKENGIYILRSATHNFELGRIELRQHAFALFSSYPPGRFTWFCRLAKYLIALAASHDAPVPLRRAAKLFDGIEIVGVNSVLWRKDPLPEDLNILDDGDKLWAEAYKDLQSIPRFIRINSDYLDLCYDCFHPKFETGFATLMSHLALTDVIAYFVIRCQDCLVLKEPLESSLIKFFQKRYLLYQNDEEG